MDKANILTLMFIACGAYIMPLVSRRLMLPSSVGEFFFGMLLAAVLGSGVTMAEPVQFLSWIGFLLLMYIAGLELDLDRISALGRRELISYGVYSLLLVGGALSATLILGFPLYFTLVIMTCAIGLLYSVLKELNMVKTALGQTMIMLGAIGEVLTLAAITVVSLFVKAGTAGETALHLLGIMIFILAVYFAMKLLRLMLWWYPEMKKFFMSVGNPSEIGVRANLANMFLFVALAAFVGMEGILGAFLGGIIFAKLFADREEMLERLSSFGYGFLIPLFFIEVGSRFQFSDFAVPEVLWGAISVSVAILAVRGVASLALLFTNLPRKQIIYVPFSQSFPLTLLVAAAAMGESGGLINHAQTSIIILTAVITAIFYPWIMKFLGMVIPVKS